MLAVPRPLAAQTPACVFHSLDSHNGVLAYCPSPFKEPKAVPDSVPEGKTPPCPQLADSWARQRRWTPPPACALFREMTFFTSHSAASARLVAVEVHCGGYSRWSGGCKERKRRGSKYVSRNSLSALHLLLFWSQSTCSPGWSQRPSGNTALFINLA